MYKILMIGLLGMLGVLTRYSVSELLNRNMAMDFPVSTLVINSIGSLLIGLSATLAMRTNALSSDWYTAVVVGFLGGFTTFSSFSLDALRLFGEEKLGVGLLYFIGSPCVGLAAAAAGIQIGKCFAL